VPDQVAFGRRLAAVLLDWFMCLGIAHLIHGNLLGGAQFLPLAIFFVEVSALTALTGSSAGQRILRLRVVDASNAGAIGVGRAIRRTLFICLVFPAVFTKEGRGYHDWFTNSVVVKY
jgi:hypothetical protein